MSSEKHGAFPEQILREIRAYEGNQRCCDCDSLDTEWASINHGTLLCLDCAGKHRNLGVQVSFIRSLHMDTWTPKQVEMLRQGGNARLRKFFARNVHNGPLTTRYLSPNAGIYRDTLSQYVEGLIKQREHSSNSGQNYFDVKVPEGPIGLTLIKNAKGQAIVSNVVDNGIAHQGGVGVSDQVVGVLGMSLEKYEDIMELLVSSSRPLTITFRRRVSPSCNASPNSSRDVVSQVVRNSSCPAAPSSPSSLSSPCSPSSQSSPSTSHPDLSRDLEHESNHLEIIENAGGNIYGRCSSSTGREMDNPASRRSCQSPNWSSEDPLVQSLSINIHSTHSIVCQRPSNVASVNSPILNHSRTSSYHEDHPNRQDSTSIQHRHSQPGIRYKVQFSAPPYGMTLTKVLNGTQVTRIIPLGQADRLGVQVGDQIVGIDGRSVVSFAEIMNALSSTSMSNASPSASTTAMTNSSASSSHISWIGSVSSFGLERRQDSLIIEFLRPSLEILVTSMYLQESSPRHSRAEKIYSTSTPSSPTLPGIFGGAMSTLHASSSSSCSSSSSSSNLLANFECRTPPSTRPYNVDIEPVSILVSSEMSSMRTLQLGHSLSESREYSVVFEEGDIGFTLEEVKSVAGVISIVVSLQKGGQAEKKGVSLHSALVSINREKYISFAHSMSLLGSSCRPMSVTFRQL